MFPALLLAAGASAPLGDRDLRFLEAYTQTRRWTLGRPTLVQPTPDGSAVLFLRSPPRLQEPRLFRFDVPTGTTAELITPEQVLAGKAEQLSAEERARRERMRVTGRGFTSFDLSHDGKLVLVTLSGRAYVVPVAGGAARQVAGPGPHGEAVFDPKLSPDGQSVSFVRGGELWVAPVGGGLERQITRGASQFVLHAQAEFVAQEELHRFTGYWWSPDSKQLVYEVVDNTGVEKLWFGDPARPDHPVEPAAYPRPGKPNAKTTFGIVSAAGGPTTWIDWDRAKWEYVVRVEWQEHGPLALELVSRDQKDLLLVSVDARTGKTRELWREHDDAWVHAAHDWRWLATGEFLWSSDSSSEWHLELHAPDGKLVRNVTAPDFGYAAPDPHVLKPGLLHVDEQARLAVVLRIADPQDEQVWEAPLDGGAPQPVTHGPDLHDGFFARDAKTWVRTSADAKGRKVFEVVGPGGRVAGELPSIQEPYPFEPRVDIRKVGPPPGFYTSLVRPHDFDPHRSYPVWLQVYGGPSSPDVVPFGPYYLVDQWIADHGYLVVRIDNRGTTRRGRAFERAVLGGFADVPLDDQVAALQALAQVEPALDVHRVGIYGHSFGGFMSALAVERRPDVFRAGVASAPVVDWLDYDTAYTERYLGVPPPAGTASDYARNGLLQYAPGLTRPLLIVHGTADDNVHFSESLRLADALFRAGKPFGFLPLSAMTHMFADAQLQVREWQRVFEFFEQHLREPAAPAHGSGGRTMNPPRAPGPVRDRRNPALGVIVAFAVAAPVVRDVYGVQVPEEITAAGHTLRLNGTGLRKKFIFKVYLASLYLEHAPDPDAQSIIRSDEVKRVDMAMLRDLDRGSIVEAVRQGFQRNSPNEMPQLTVRLIRFVSEIPDLKEGQQLSITYVPGQGTTVVVDDGTAKTTVEGKDFADALFRVWLGSDPVDADLKERLLGR